MDVHPTNNVSIGIDPYPYHMFGWNSTSRPGEVSTSFNLRRRRRRRRKLY